MLANPAHTAKNLADMKANLRMHCLPESLIEGKVSTYDDFLEERRRLMALKIKNWFESL